MSDPLLTVTVDEARKRVLCRHAGALQIVGGNRRCVDCGLVWNLTEHPAREAAADQLIAAVHRDSEATQEEEIIQHVVAHWFTQGGKAQFGELDNPRNADELVAAIFRVVRKQYPAHAALHRQAFEAGWAAGYESRDYEESHPNWREETDHGCAPDFDAYLAYLAKP